MRLAERRLIETRWEPASRPGLRPRHTYRLTTSGAVIAVQSVTVPDTAPAKGCAGNRIRQAKEVWWRSRSPTPTASGQPYIQWQAVVGEQAVDRELG